MASRLASSPVEDSFASSQCSEPPVCSRNQFDQRRVDLGVAGVGIIQNQTRRSASPAQHQRDVEGEGRAIVQAFTNVLCGPLLAHATKRGDKLWSMQSQGDAIAMDSGSLNQSGHQRRLRRGAVLWKGEVLCQIGGPGYDLSLILDSCLRTCDLLEHPHRIQEPAPQSFDDCRFHLVGR